MLFCKKYTIKYENFLHIAPEAPLIKLFKSLSNNYICGIIDAARSGIPNTLYINLADITFKNEFDCIFASHILELIVDDRKAMKEIYDALVFNGRFITVVPQILSQTTTYEDSSIVTEEDRTTHFGQKNHVRCYGLDFSKRLKEAGFYIKVHYMEHCEKYVENMVYDEKIQLSTNEESEKYGFGTSVILYECIKKEE